MVTLRFVVLRLVDFVVDSEFNRLTCRGRVSSVAGSNVDD